MLRLLLPGLLILTSIALISCSVDGNLILQTKRAGDYISANAIQEDIAQAGKDVSANCTLLLESPLVGSPNKDLPYSIENSLSLRKSAEARYSFVDDLIKQSAPYLPYGLGGALTLCAGLLTAYLKTKKNYAGVIKSVGDALGEMPEGDAQTVKDRMKQTQDLLGVRESVAKDVKKLCTA